MSHLVGPLTYQQLVKDRAEQVERLTKINAEVTAITAERNESQSFVDNYTSIKEALQTSIEAQTALVASNENAYNNAQDALNAAETVASEADSSLDEAQSLVSEKSADIASLQETLAELEAEGADPEKIDDLKAKIAAEEAELAVLVSNLNVAQVAMNSAQANLDLAVTNVKAAQQAFDTSRDTLKSLQVNLDDNAEALQSSEDELADVNDRLNEVNKAQTETQGEYDKWIKDNQALLDNFEYQDLIRDNGSIIGHVNINKAAARPPANDEEIAATAQVLTEVIDVDLIQNLTAEERKTAEDMMDKAASESNFPSADKAREKALENIWGFSEVQLQIETAMNAGSFEAKFTTLEDSTIWALQRLGYSVYSTINSPSLGQSKMIVSWENIQGNKA